MNLQCESCGGMVRWSLDFPDPCLVEGSQAMAALIDYEIPHWTVCMWRIARSGDARVPVIWESYRPKAT